MEAAQDSVAANRVFRGSQLTQLIANDIHRSDITGGTGKLATIYGAQKDIYVQLRTGSLGIVGPSRYSADGHIFDQANWDVTGSISLIADAGDILVGGTLKAANDLYIRAGHDTMLGSGSIYAGDVLHLEGQKLLKNYGGATIGSGNKVQLLQNQGWFWTRDWLTDQDINYSLSVQAKTIIVNSSHRFVNKDLFLRASDNILQQEQVVSARKITYSAGNDITVRYYPSGWRRNHPDIQSTANWWDVGTAGLRGHTLLAQGGGLVLYAGNDIHLASGKIYSYGNLDIVAGRNVLSEPVYKDTWKWNRPGDVGWSFSSKYSGVKPGHIASKVSIRELRAYENQISARGDIKIVAGGSASFIGSRIVSQTGNISIEALNGGVNFVAAPGFWSYNYTHRTVKRRLFGFYKKTTTYQFESFEDIYKRSRLKAANGNITIASTGTNGDYASVLSAGTSFEAQNISISTPNGNISAGTYAERSITESSSHSSTKIFWIVPFGRSDTSITDNILINYGNDFTADEILDIAAPNGTLSITGGSLTAQQVNLTAKKLLINAAINSTRHTFFSEKDNMITITTIQSGFDRETAVLPTITSTDTPVFNISGEVHIAGVRGATLNSQLLNIIGSRQYDSELLGIASPEDVTSATEASATIQDQYLRDFTLPGASDGAQFAYLGTLMNDYNATYHTISLRDHEWYDKQVRLNPAFKALLTVVATYITGGIDFNIGNKFIQAGVQSGTANLIAGVAEGTITGNFDMDEILRGALLAGVSTTISGFLTENIDFGAGLSDQSPFVNDVRDHFTPAALVDRAGDAIINNGVSNLVHGQGFFDGLDQAGRTFLVSETMAIAQFGIGELGNGTDTQWEGSIGHLLLHGGVGCLALEALDGDCVSGFFSGASSSLLAGANLTDEQKVRLAPLVGALTGFVFSGGNAVNVSFGGTVAGSAIENNYLGHTELESMQKELRACEFNDSACFNAVATKYLRISQGLDAEFAACTTDACRMYHLSRILVADQTDAFHKMMSTLAARQYLANNNYTAALETLQYDRADSYSDLMSKPGFTQAARDQLKAEVTEFACIGATANSCSIETRASLDTWGLLSADEKQILNRDIFIEIVAAQQKARNALKPSICGSVSGQACETLIDDHIAAQQARAARIGGAFMLVGGTFEIVSGALVGGFTCETGIGCLAAAGILTSGVDNAGHGMVALWTGEQQTTFGAQLLMKTGLSQTQAEILYGLASAGVELAAMKYLVKRPTLLTDELLRNYRATNSTLTPDNAFDIIRDFRGRTIITDANGGRGTVAVTEINGNKYFGVNSINLTNSDKMLARSWRDRLGLTRGQDQVLFHAEAHSLMRAYDRANGNLPQNIVLYVDRASCGTCQTYLPALISEMGISNLTLNFSSGRSAIIRNGIFDWLN
ncbi:MAG: deaminase [Geopsychrobacter sp.]|nr:deaminase [Geopsychrobacter sp.]